ncbi:hypothetical protein [Microbispora catharanthi]|uniref:Uncharacterized protein n=1 Tax=Microbispora catharanthi TaxID=1712871 RepID=A0A5N6C0A3_9ACTN|nr:hypothetical protein [Microbispora catharanthi]KAB8185863.1 hypothetical protein FH610_008790 [Microbispora catharanthi]
MDASREGRPLTPGALGAAALASRFFAPLGRRMSAALEDFTPEERRVIGRFLGRGIEAVVAARQETADDDA